MIKNNNEALAAYDEINAKYLQLEATCQKMLPNVDPKLVEELFIHSKDAKIGKF